VTPEEDAASTGAAGPSIYAGTASATRG
jgi:hypothetical protein